MVRGWPFVGRAAQLAQLSEIVRSGGSVLLLGEAGIGKSALAARLLQSLPPDTVATGALSGQALSGQVPFEAFAPLLAGIAAPQEPVTPGAVAEQVYAALRPADGDRVVLLVDDVHLLDPASVQVLFHLVGTASSGGRTALVLTSSAPDRLPEVVRRLVHDGCCRSVEVSGLPDAELAVALEQALGAPVEPQTERTFLRPAEGNPLLLRELLTAAEDAGCLGQVAGLWRLVADPPLARTVRDLVSARVADRPEIEVAALQTVAAAEPLPLEVAGALVGWPVLEQLEAARLVAVRDELGRSQVSTAHPLYGDVIRAELPRLRLRRLRLAAAEVLAAAPDPAAPHDLVRAALWRLDAGERPDPDQLLAAAQAARTISLDVAERLARAALAAGASVQTTVLLAEILTHARQGEEAAVLLRGLPPDSLSPDLRDAMVYLGALQEGLMGGDPETATQLVAGVLAGEASASDRLKAIHCSFLAFDGRFGEALAAGSDIAVDPDADPETRTIAALGVVGSTFWLGHGRAAVRLADDLLPVADLVRGALPYGAPSLELFAICALVDDGDLDAAETRSRAMVDQAARRDDPFAAPRAEYCLARVLLARGRPASAARLFRRSGSALTPFDLTFVRNMNAMLARAEALAGNVAAGRAALDLPDAPPSMPPYEPDWELAEAAVAAADLDLAEAAERAAYVAGLTATRFQWPTALHAAHDAARYGAAARVLPQLRLAAERADAGIGPVLVAHAEALAANDARGLDAASLAFAGHGQLALAVEAALAAAAQYRLDGDQRAGRASAARAEQLGADGEPLALPWLSRTAGGPPLTNRERQVAVLAANGHADAEIARRLGISVRTVQTHLAHVYAKLGIHGRRELITALI